MLKRLFFGVGEGLAAAAIVVLALRGLGADWSSLAVVYPSALIAGVLVALVAGRPVWAPGGKLEAAVKSAVGAFISVTTMFGIRKWLPHVTVDMGVFGAGILGNVPAASLPLVASALALVFEIDDAFGPEVNPPASPAAPRPPVAISEPPPSGEQHVDQSSARARTERRRAGSDE